MQQAKRLFMQPKLFDLCKISNARLPVQHQHIVSYKIAHSHVQQLGAFRLKSTDAKYRQQEVKLQPKQEVVRGSAVKDAKLKPDESLLKVEWHDETFSDFPYVWLRDNCQCEECFSQKYQARSITWKDFDVDCKLEDCKLDKSGSSVSLTWEDGHKSVFNARWLQERGFAKEQQDAWLSEYRPARVLWQVKDFNSIPRFKYHDVIAKDGVLLDWLMVLDVYGISIIDAVPPDDRRCRQLADKVAFPKRTHYGEEFVVQARIDTTNAAYTSEPFQLHTDMPYYEYKPGINMLHCLAQFEGEGGENQLVDAFHVAKLLKDCYPDVYKILSTTLLEWSDIGEEHGAKFHTVYRAPVICEDWEGRVYRVNYSHPQRDTHFTVPVDQVLPWYKAYRTFTDLLQHKNNCVYYKLKPGELLSFDNLRICHGRSGFSSSTGGSRFLFGSYLDWDEARSKIRVLKTQLGTTS